MKKVKNKVSGDVFDDLDINMDDLIVNFVFDFDFKLKLVKEKVKKLVK